LLLFRFFFFRFFVQSESEDEEDEDDEDDDNEELSSPPLSPLFCIGDMKLMVLALVGLTCSLPPMEDGIGVC
jgi:hypothetical protein